MGSNALLKTTATGATFGGAANAAQARARKSCWEAKKATCFGSGCRAGKAAALIFLQTLAGGGDAFADVRLGWLLYDLSEKIHIAKIAGDAEGAQGYEGQLIGFAQELTKALEQAQAGQRPALHSVATRGVDAFDRAD